MQCFNSLSLLFLMAKKISCNFISNQELLKGYKNKCLFKIKNLIDKCVFYVYKCMV